MAMVVSTNLSSFQIFINIRHSAFFPGLGNFRKGKAATGLVFGKEIMSKFVISDTLYAAVNAKSVVNFKVSIFSEIESSTGRDLIISKLCLHPR